MTCSRRSTGGSDGHSPVSHYLLEVERAVQDFRRLLHEHREVSQEEGSGSARYADQIAVTLVELCQRGRSAKAEDAIEIAEMVPKLLRPLLSEIDVLLER